MGVSVYVARTRMTWLARARALRPSRWALLMVLGFLVGPFFVAAWRALVRLAVRAFRIDVFP